MFVLFCRSFRYPFIRRSQHRIRRMLIHGPGRVCNTNVPLNSLLGRDLGSSVLKEIPKVHNHVAECILPFVKRGVLADRSKAASPRKTSVKRRFFAIHRRCFLSSKFCPTDFSLFAVDKSGIDLLLVFLPERNTSWSVEKLGMLQRISKVMFFGRIRGVWK